MPRAPENHAAACSTRPDTAPARGVAGMSIRGEVQPRIEGSGGGADLGHEIPRSQLRVRTQLRQRIEQRLEQSARGIVAVTVERPVHRMRQQRGMLAERLFALFRERAETLEVRLVAKDLLDHLAAAG